MMDRSPQNGDSMLGKQVTFKLEYNGKCEHCLLYTSDAADEE